MVFKVWSKNLNFWVCCKQSKNKFFVKMLTVKHQKKRKQVKI